MPPPPGFKTIHPQLFPGLPRFIPSSRDGQVRVPHCPLLPTHLPTPLPDRRRGILLCQLRAFYAFCPIVSEHRPNIRYACANRPYATSIILADELLSRCKFLKRLSAWVLSISRVLTSFFSDLKGLGTICVYANDPKPSWSKKNSKGIVFDMKLSTFTVATEEGNQLLGMNMTSCNTATTLKSCRQF